MIGSHKCLCDLPQGSWRCVQCLLYFRRSVINNAVGVIYIYPMEGNFGGCKLWRIGKENFIGGINFGELITKV